MDAFTTSTSKAAAAKPAANTQRPMTKPQRADFQGADPDVFPDAAARASADSVPDEAVAAGAQPATDAPADTVVTEATVADAAVEAEAGGISGLFGSALGAVASSGLVGPGVGLGVILLSANTADGGDKEEMFFTPNTQAAGVTAGEASIGGTDAQGNTTAVALSNTAIQAGGNAEPLLSTRSLVIGNTSGEAPGEVPVTIDLTEDAPIININGGALAEGDVMVNALQASVTAQTLVQDLLVDPASIAEEPLVLEISELNLGGQSIPVPGLDSLAPPSGGSGGDAQAGAMGGADLMSALDPSALPLSPPMSSEAGTGGLPFTFPPMGA